MSQTQGATGYSCASWAVKGRVPHQTSQSPSRERPTLARRRLREPSTGSSLPVQFRRVMMEIHPSPHPVNPSFRPFEERRKAGSSTAQGPDGLTVLHLRHLREHGLGFLTELFNLSVARVDIPAIWKNSVIIPILRAGKPREQYRSYRPFSLLWPAAKILERLLVPTIVKALSTPASQRLQTEALHYLGPAPNYC